MRLECLEDRAVPATFSVNTTLDDVTPGNGKLSLREAITRANATPEADVIALPAGVLKVTIPGAGENANATGDFDITATVTIRGAGAGLSIINAQQLDRIFDVAGTAPSPIKVVLEKLTVHNGKVTGFGGGILVGNADLLVRDCTVRENRASQDGGGISNGLLPASGDVKVVRSTVVRNVTSGSGGGISVTGGGTTLTVRDSTVRRNVADLSGGGVDAWELVLTNSTVGGNSAGGGGGINTPTHATLTNCTVSNNAAVGQGGGIWGSSTVLTNVTIRGNTARFEGGGLIGSAATLTNCTVSGNTAGTEGGGIFVGNQTLTNVTVSGNTAGTGGGIWATTAALLNCTVVENIAHTGGGLFHNSGGTFSVRNTIVALNQLDFTGVGPDVSGAFASQGHNLIGNTTGGAGFFNGVDGNIVGTAANPIDPKLGPLANNGGRTKTHALKAGSPAIDRGDNAAPPPTDQRGLGFPRVKDGNGDGIAKIDIGAFER